MLALLIDHYLDFVPAGSRELDADFIRSGGEVAVAVFDLRVDQVARFDLILGAGGGTGLLFLFTFNFFF